MVQQQNEHLAIRLCPTAKHSMQHLTVKNQVDEKKAYGFFQEEELTRKGVVENHNVILTTNKECSFKCVMCDLWKNTLDYRVDVGVVAKQVQDALGKLPAAQHLKIYNVSLNDI